jgi:hypothetical protein
VLASRWWQATETRPAPTALAATGCKPTGQHQLQRPCHNDAQIAPKQHQRRLGKLDRQSWVQHPTSWPFTTNAKDSLQQHIALLIHADACSYTQITTAAAPSCARGWRQNYDDLHLNICLHSPRPPRGGGHCFWVENTTCTYRQSLLHHKPLTTLLCNGSCCMHSRQARARVSLHALSPWP